MKCATKFCRHTPHKGRVRCSKCMMKEWRAKYPVKAMLAQLKSRSKHRGIEFTLTLEQLEGWFKTHVPKDHERGNTGECLSVDRIDHTKGYSIDNIQPLSISENSRKWHYQDKHQTQIECPF